MTDEIEGQTLSQTPNDTGQTPEKQPDAPSPQTLVDLNATDDKGQRLYFDRAYVEQLRAEAANHRTLYQQAKTALEAHAAPGKDKEKADKGQTPRQSSPAPQDGDVQQQLQALVARERDLLLDNAVLSEAAKSTAARARFIDPSDAIRLIDRSKLTVKDGGVIDGVGEALDALATAKPHLLEQGKRAQKLSATNPGSAGTGRSADRAAVESTRGGTRQSVR